MTRNPHDTFWDERKTANSILECLEDGGPQSRAVVAKKLGLSRTTLTNIITPLIEKKLVREQGEQTNSRGRGRPGIPVDLETGQWFALGAVFHSRHWVFVVTNLKGEVVATKSTRSSITIPEKFIESLIKGIGSMRKLSPGLLLPGIGIGAPGLVNWEKGEIIRADDLGWINIDVGKKVESATGLTPYVINRNRAAGIAEARFGGGKHLSNFLYVGIGTGISAAIMLDGDLLHGASYSAGEIGHVVVDPKGPRCGCGKRGCLQTVAAEGALAADAERLFRSGHIALDSELGRVFSAGGGVKGEEVFRAAAKGDRGAEKCVRHMAIHLGRALGNMITILNPGKVILGGPLMRDGEVLVRHIQEIAAEWAMEHPFSSVKIEASDLDEFAGARGAACLVLRNKLELSGWK